MIKIIQNILIFFCLNFTYSQSIKTISKNSITKINTEIKSVELQAKLIPVNEYELNEKVKKEVFSLIQNNLKQMDIEISETKTCYKLEKKSDYKQHEKIIIKLNTVDEKQENQIILPPIDLILMKKN